MIEGDNSGSCPIWCTREHADARSERHLGSREALAAPESGSGAWTARLISDRAESGCAVEIEHWEHSEGSTVISIEAADALVDALDDGGQVAFQRLAHLIVAARSAG